MKPSESNGPFAHTTESLILSWCRKNPEHGCPCMRDLNDGNKAIIAVAFMDPKQGRLAVAQTWEGVLEALKAKYPQDFDF